MMSSKQTVTQQSEVKFTHQQVADALNQIVDHLEVWDKTLTQYQSKINNLSPHQKTMGDLHTRFFGGTVQRYLFLGLAGATLLAQLFLKDRNVRIYTEIATVIFMIFTGITFWKPRSAELIQMRRQDIEAINTCFDTACQALRELWQPKSDFLCVTLRDQLKKLQDHSRFDAQGQPIFNPSDPIEEKVKKLIANACNIYNSGSIQDKLPAPSSKEARKRADLNRLHRSLSDVVSKTTQTLFNEKDASHDFAKLNLSHASLLNRMVDLTHELTRFQSGSPGSSANPADPELYIHYSVSQKVVALKPHETLPLSNTKITT